MKVSKEQAALNRQSLLDAAGTLFKVHGVDGIGVADLCRVAGLTHGALYKHFVDKQDLVAQSFRHAFRTGYDRVTQVPAGQQLSLSTYLDRYLDPRVRDDMAAGCPLVATACETGRQGLAVSEAYAQAYTELRDGVQQVLPDREDAAQARATATLVVAAFIGAMALSRGIQKADPALADEVLTSVRSALARATRCVDPEP